MKRILVILIIFLILFLLITFQNYSLSQERAILPPFDWPISNPQEQGLNPNIFESANKVAETLPYIYSFLVVKNGFLISECYFNSKNKNDAYYIASASKSYLSALIGIALREKYLVSLDQKMMDFFPEHITPQMDQRKFDINIKHLLTMTTGFPFDSTDSHWEKWYSSPSMIKFAIDLQLYADPGERWAYSTSSTHILSGIITKATGMSAYKFANQYLFDPLNISIRYWGRDPEGYYRGGWDMHFTPRDMARFGLLYLNKGQINGLQIIPKDWVEESLQDYCPTYFDWGPIKESKYGYLWWLGKILDYNVYYANGHGGQIILVIPDLDMVIVTTTDANNSFEVGWKQNLETLRFIVNYVLSPIRGMMGSPPFSPSDIAAFKVANHGLAYQEYLSVIQWQPNHRNNTVNILKYKIYHMVGVNRYCLAEVDANTYEFWHRRVEKNKEYTYAISSVTAENKESGVTLISVKDPIY